eukprot:Em0010g484a
MEQEEKDLFLSRFEAARQVLVPGVTRNATIGVLNALLDRVLQHIPVTRSGTSSSGWGSSPSQEHWWPVDNAGPKQAVWTRRLILTAIQHWWWLALGWYLGIFYPSCIVEFDDLSEDTLKWGFSQQAQPWSKQTVDDYENMETQLTCGELGKILGMILIEVGKIMGMILGMILGQGGKILVMILGQGGKILVMILEQILGMILGQGGKILGMVMGQGGKILGMILRQGGKILDKILGMILVHGTPIYYTNQTQEIPSTLGILIANRQGKKKEQGVDDLGSVMFEPSHDFMESHGLAVAHAVVGEDNEDIVVQILNPTPYSVQVQQGSRIGCLRPLLDVCAIELEAVARQGDNRSHARECIIHQLVSCAQGVTQKERQQLTDLLTEFESILSDREDDLGRTHLVYHKIDTRDAVPIRQSARRLPYFQSEERLMEQVLAGLHWSTCLVYLDDIIVFSRIVADHLDQLKDVFTRLKIAGLTLKPSKCHLLQMEVRYLGHVVSGKGIQTDPENVRSVFDWPIPLNQKDLKRFLGLASYYCRFVQGFAQVAAPLNALTNKGKEWMWTADCTHAFLELKKRLVSTPVLVMPQFTQEFILDTDACGEGLGAVLSQAIEGEEKVVAYASKTLTRTERKYCATRREMLALANLRKLWFQRDQLMLKEGVLYRQWKDVPGGGLHKRLQLVLTASLVPGVLSGLHDTPVGGHLGVKKTLEKVQMRFYWPSQKKDVEKWCASCSGVARAPLQLEDSVSRPLERIAMDIVGPLPVTERGNRYILVGDYFTRWKEAYPMKDMEAQTVACILVNEFICRLGVPDTIHTDQGRNFESKLIKELCQMLGIKKTRTTPYHPQSDGMVERFNRTLLNMLSIAVGEDEMSWDLQLPLLLLAYRTSVHDTTGTSPFELMYGREVRLPEDIMFALPPLLRQLELTTRAF